MGKHGKNKDETSNNPVIKVLKQGKPKQDLTRLQKDIEILDKGWNNTEEGKADLISGRKPGRTAKSNGKHAK